MSDPENTVGETSSLPPVGKPTPEVCGESNGGSSSSSSSNEVGNEIVENTKIAIAMKVTGTVKWFNVKSGYGFINRNDTKEDVFVHQTAITKNNPKKAVRSVGDGESVEFDVVLGEKGNEAANVTGPSGTFVKGSPYASDKRRGGLRRGGRGFYPRGNSGRGAKSQRKTDDELSPNDEEGASKRGAGNSTRSFRPRYVRRGGGGFRKNFEGDADNSRETTSGVDGDSHENMEEDGSRRGRFRGGGGGFRDFRGSLQRSGYRNHYSMGYNYRGGRGESRGGFRGAFRGLRDGSRGRFNGGNGGGSNGGGGGYRRRGIRGIRGSNFDHNNGGESSA